MIRDVKYEWMGGPTGAGDAELLVDLQVGTRRAPAGETELFVAVLLPAEGLQNVVLATKLYPQ